MSRDSSSFYDALKGARKVLILDLGFLGDTVHLLPAAWAVRQAVPQARLEVVVAQHITGLLRLTPWVDAVLGYPRFPKGPKWYQDFGRVRAFRRSGYDAVINLNGSDRSSILTWATGAPLRLGRVPPKLHWFWPHLFTHTVAVPYESGPIFQQRLECLQRAGFPKGAAEFAITIPEEVAARVEREVGATPFVHVSPFTTQDQKELPEGALVEVLAGLRQARPDLELVVSCAPNERERGKLASLLSKLPERPWRVFDGPLNLVGLTALIRRSRLHLGGDSGALHLALMAGAPTVSWFRRYPGMVEWLPQGERHGAVIGEASPEGLRGVDAGALLTAALKHAAP